MRKEHTHAQFFLLFRRTIIRVICFGRGRRSARVRAGVMRDTHSRRTRFFFLKGFSRKSQKNTVSKQEEKIFYPHEILVPWYRGTAVIIIIIITTMIIIKRMSEDEVLFVPRDYVFAVVLFLCSCVSSPRISIRLASAWKTTRDGEEEKRERERHTHTTRRHAKTMCTLYLPLLFSISLSEWEWKRHFKEHTTQLLL